MAPSQDFIKNWLNTFKSVQEGTTVVLDDSYKPATYLDILSLGSGSGGATGAAGGILQGTYPNPTLNYTVGSIPMDIIVPSYSGSLITPLAGGETLKAAFEKINASTIYLANEIEDAVGVRSINGYTQPLQGISIYSTAGGVSVDMDIISGVYNHRIVITQASTSSAGLLSSTDWNTFNNKGSGTVTSVGLSGISSFITVGSSPITSSGTLSLALASQSANLVFASPNGSSGTPTFRSLVSADLPAGLGLISGLTATRIPYATAATTLADSVNLIWDNTKQCLAINNPTLGASPAALEINPVSGRASIRLYTSTPSSAANGEIWFNSTTGLNFQGGLNINDNTIYSTVPVTGFSLSAASILSFRSGSNLICSLLGGASRILLINGSIQFATNATTSTASGGANIISPDSGVGININSFNNAGNIGINGFTTITRNTSANVDLCFVQDSGTVSIPNNNSSSGIRVQRTFTGCTFTQTSAFLTGVTSLIEHKGNYANSLYNSIGVLGSNTRVGNTSQTIRGLFGGAFFNQMAGGGATPVDTGTIAFGLVGALNLVSATPTGRYAYTNCGSLYLGNSIITATSGNFYHLFIEDASKTTYTNILSGNTIAKPSFAAIWGLFLEGTRNTTNHGKSYIANGLGIAFGTQPTTGADITAHLHIGSATSTVAHINLVAGSTTSPNNGDIWFDGTNLSIRIAGVTKTFVLV